MFSRCSHGVCRIFPGCFQDASMVLVGLVEFDDHFKWKDGLMIQGIRWSPAIWWSPAIRWSIRSMDFDKPKVYGDTSITDGLVVFWTKHDLLGHPSASFRIKTAKIGPNGTKQARFCDTGLRKLNPHWWWRWWLIWAMGGYLEELRRGTFSNLSLVNTFPYAVKFQLPNSPLVNWKRG